MAVVLLRSTMHSTLCKGKLLIDGQGPNKDYGVLYPSTSCHSTSPIRKFEPTILQSFQQIILSIPVSINEKRQLNDTNKLI